MIDNNNNNNNENKNLNTNTTPNINSTFTPSNNAELIHNSSATFNNNENLQPNMEKLDSNIQENNQNNSVNQQIANNDIDDDILLKAYIGNNYDKITTKPFNFAGFFFTTFYMFYRKMFLYGVLLFLLNLIVLNLINNFMITTLFNVLVGLLVNKIYLYYAKNKIAKIKLQNSGKDKSEIKRICVLKGGTSVGKIFLGFFVEIIITFIVLIIILIAEIGGFFGELIDEFLNLSNWNITTNSNVIDINNDDSNIGGTLVENVKLTGHVCLNTNCNVYIKERENEVIYKLNVNNSEFFKELNDYSEYINLNIYYVQNGDEKVINNYKIFMKSSNADISNVSNENELREKLGLYSFNILHTESFTLKKIGLPGIRYKDDEKYTYITYTFIDNKNNEYEMDFINPDTNLNLIEGNQYSVTFEVFKGTFGDEFNIKSIQ